MSLIPGSDYAGGGVLPGYQNPVPTQENMKKSRRRTTSPYSSVTQVQAAYKNGEISYNEAYQILRNQFGMSDGDATDILTVEVASCEGEYVPPIGPEVRPGDFDGDGDHDIDDYNASGAALGLCAADANRDSIVDFGDLLIVINDWGTTCE